MFFLLNVSHYFSLSFSSCCKLGVADDVGRAMLFPSTLILLHAQLGNHTGLLVTQQVVLCLVKHSVYKFNIFIFTSQWFLLL